METPKHAPSPQDNNRPDTERTGPFSIRAVLAAFLQGRVRRTPRT